MPPCEVLIVEGVGAGVLGVRRARSPAWSGWTPRPTYGWQRGLARDGEQMRERLRAWRAQEDAMFARERTRAHADVVVDGQTGKVAT